MFTKLVDYEKFIQKPRFTIDKNLWKNPSQKDLVESHRCYYLENMDVTCVITWSAHIHDLSTYKYLVTLSRKFVVFRGYGTRRVTVLLRLSTLKSTRSYARVARGTCVRKSMNDITIVESAVDPGSPVYY